MAVSRLSGIQHGGQQSQGVGGGAGHEPPADQIVQHGSAAVLHGKHQRFVHRIEQVTPAEKTFVMDRHQTDTLGEVGSNIQREVAGGIVVANHPQQRRKPVAGVDLGVGMEVNGRGTSHPSLVYGIVDVVRGPGGQIPKSADPDIGTGIGLSAGQTNQQRSGVGAGGGLVQPVVGLGGALDQSQCGQGVRCA